MNKQTEQEQKQPLPVEPETDSIADRLHEVEGIDEDIAQIIAQNWRQVAIGIAVLVLAVWLFNEMRSGRQEKAAQISKEFVEAQKIFETLNTPEPVADEETEAAEGEATNEKSETATDEDNQQLIAMQEKLKVVAESGQGDFYPGAAKLYRAVDALKANKVEEGLQILASFPIARYESNQQTAVASGSDIAENLLPEYAALLYAKGLLSKETPDLEKARTYLTGLAYQAQILNVEALIALGRIAETKEDRQVVTVVAHDISVGRPELADSIESSLAPYGFELN